MSTSVNPYQPPAIAPVVVSDTVSLQRIHFGGSMTLEQGEQIDRLIRGKRKPRHEATKRFSPSNLILLGVLIWFGMDSLLHA